MPRGQTSWALTGQAWFDEGAVDLLSVLAARVKSWPGQNADTLRLIVAAAQSAAAIGDQSLSQSLLMLVSNRTHTDAKGPIADLYDET